MYYNIAWQCKQPPAVYYSTESVSVEAKHFSYSVRDVCIFAFIYVAVCGGLSEANAVCLSYSRGKETAENSIAHVAIKCW